MKPAPFDYLAAETLDAAVSALARAGGDGKLLAGGQSLVPMLNFRLVRPSILVDINRVPGLGYVDQTGDVVRIGALTRHHALETSPVIKARLPIMAAAMQHVAHLAVRNRGTIGGSLSHADPAAELPMLAVLLDARIGIRSPRGRRAAEAGRFFTGSPAPDLKEVAIVTDCEFPALARDTGGGSGEVARRPRDCALAGVGAARRGRDAKGDRARSGMMGFGDTPLRALEAESLLAGKAIDAGAIEAAASAIEASVEP